MRYCLVVGCYKLPQFVELVIKRSRLIFGDDLPILLSDDLSEKSSAIKALAERHGCDYSVGAGRRSHFSGDMQSFISGLRFLEDLDGEILVKLSQRLVPVLPAFREALDHAMADPRIQICLPGRIPPNQIARPGARFYCKFGILTDVLAVRRGAISPEELLQVYRERCAPGRKSSESFAETTWGFLLATRFPNCHKLLSEWTVHRPFQPKIYLRKSQSNEAEYAAIGKMEGLSGPWDVREWGAIEPKHHYKAKADRV